MPVNNNQNQDLQVAYICVYFLMARDGEIIVDSIHKIFKKGKPDEVRAVDGIGFTINKGELFGLLGPNGAGKTTLIKCISTLLIPDSGSVKLGGYDIYREPLEVRRHI